MKLKNEGSRLNISVNGINPIVASDRHLVRNFYSIIVLPKKNESNIDKDFDRSYSNDYSYLNRSYSNLFFIEMYLGYDAIWTPKAAYYVHVHQLILLDKDYNVKMIIVSPSEHKVS
jgi:lipopolysaccharide assembly outer membrane protein LptD (OstA)